MALNKQYSLKELATLVNAELKGDPDCTITGIAPLDKATTGQITFLHDPHYRQFLSTTSASAVILAPKYADCCQRNILITKNPYLGYAKVASLFVPKQTLNSGIHPKAVVGENCKIATTASIGANCVIGHNVEIGEHTRIYPGSIIDDNCVIGAECTIWSNVTIYHGVRLGERVIVHSGVVIGSDGFGMANDNGKWYKIPQLAGVVIGNEVEIGANTCIDRGALEDTVIEEGVKLDNLIQVAHNVHIGAHTVIAGCVAIGGSTKIGKHCMIGGAASINGHIQIPDQTVLTAAATAASSLTEPGIYSSGIPLQPNQLWRKNAVRFQQLDDIARRLRKLERMQEGEISQ